MRNIILIITLTMSVMLFTSNPIDSSYRLYQALWNTGHLFFFASLVWILITQTSLNNKSWLIMLVFSLLLGVFLGGVIEVIQLLAGRYMEWEDLLTDSLGALLGFLLVQLSLPIKRRPTGKMTRPAVILLSGIVVLAAFYPVFNILIDDLNMKSDIPVIADFESVTTLSRWETRHVRRFEIDNQFYTQGLSSLLIEFEKGKYPNVSLEAMYPDWSAYQLLNLSIHNGQNENLEISVKVYDRQHHQSEQAYNDRFNRKITLSSGWNALKIKLSDIRNSPKNRAMNLDEIAGFSLFVHEPDQTKVIHLDNIHLSK